LGIDYVEIKQYICGYRCFDDKARNYKAIFSNIEEFIDHSEIKFFYPKNLFLVDKDLEVYVFLDGKILRGRSLEESRIELKIFNLRDLVDFKCECIDNREEYFHKITLKFENDEIIVFDSMTDTNESWKYKFDNQIKEIIKVLIKNY